MKQALLISFMLALLTATSAIAEKVRLAVTSSFHNSGLSDHIIPHIETDLEIDIQLIVVGTGQALKLGENGDVDAILVHSKPDEEEFVKIREEKDSRLGAPKLIVPSIQVNMRAGEMPPPERNGVSYLKVPLRVKERK